MTGTKNELIQRILDHHALEAGLPFLLQDYGDNKHIVSEFILTLKRYSTACTIAQLSKHIQIYVAISANNAVKFVLILYYNTFTNETIYLAVEEGDAAVEGDDQLVEGETDDIVRI